jgi:phage I-like protein
MKQLKVAANSSNAVDPTQFVPMAVYQEAVQKAGNADAAAKAKEIDDLIVAACGDGRLTGKATINWYKDLALTKPDYVKAQLEALPKIAALTQQQTSKSTWWWSTQTPPDVDDVQANRCSIWGLRKINMAKTEKQL